MTKKLICCDVFKEELNLISLPPGLNTEFISMGLHLHPKKLHQKVQEALDNVSGCSLVILGFGLCGGSLNGIKAPDCRIVMPRVHDCIPVLLGSVEKFNSLRQQDHRTFYFSGGWVEGERMMIPEYERTCLEWGPQKALRVFRMMFEHYNRLMYIHTGHPRDAAALRRTRDFGGILGLPCLETPGDLKQLELLINGPWDSEDFVIIPPHGIINQDEFLIPGGEIQVQGL